MEITHDVITDLWPLYESGEASADTRRLVSEYLAKDTDLAARLERSPIGPAAIASPATPDAERALLSRTKTLLRRRSLLLALALVTMALVPAITTAHLHFAEWGLGTGFSRLPAWENFFALGCLSASAAFWAGYFLVRERLRVRGF